MRADRESIALGAVATQFFTNGAVFASVAPRLPEVRDQVGVSSAGIGLLMSLAGMAGLLSSWLVGRVVGRFGSRRVMVVGGIAMGAALGLVGLAGGAIVLLVGLAAISLFDVFVDVSMNLQGSRLSRRRAAPVMNRLHGLWSLGTVTGGLVSSWLAAAGVSPRAHLAGAAVVLAAIVTIGGRGLLPVDEPVLGHEESPDGSARRAALIVLVLFGVAGFTAIAIEQSASEWSSFRLADDFGAEPGVAALGFVAMTAGMTVGRLGGDWMTVRLGRGRLTVAAVATAGVGLVLATVVPSRAACMGGFVLTGLGAATMLPALYDAAAHHPGRPGVGLGALTAGLRVSSLSVPALIGALAATSWTVGAALAVVTVPSLLLFAVTVAALDARQRRG